jgi:non-ribosomal peptide synthetase component E (peptide arylation enzyme)
MRKYGSGGQIATDRDGEPEPIRTTASRPLSPQDVTDIEHEDGPAVQELEE